MMSNVLFYVLYALLGIFCIDLAFAFKSMKKQLHDMRNELDNLSDFSLKHIQDHNHE